MKLMRLALTGSLLLTLGACGQANSTLTSAAVQDPPQYGTPFAGVPDTRDINLYQVNIRAYSAAGDLAGVTERLDEIHDVGTNVIYLMPIYPVGEDERSKVSTSASPYSIKDFKAVGSEFGSLEDLRTLVDGAHERGMAVILDFVVNQTAWDHPWITEHPDWYIQDKNGVVQPLTPFPDVAALDLSNQELRAALTESLRYWVFAANVDGFRFDYANNPTLEFWKQINGNLRSIASHDLILFAEGDRLANFTVGFDLNFGFKWYYDALLPISTGASVKNLRTTTETEYTDADETQQVARYTGNHDTSGDGTPLEVFGGPRGVMANFVVSAYMRGVPFLYGGQEVAFSESIPFPWDSVTIDWSQNPQVTAEFKKVLEFRTKSKAIRRGALTDFSSDDVAAFTKVASNKKVAVFVNLRDHRTEYIVPAAMAGTYSDAYTGTSVTLAEGESLPLEGFAYRALTTAHVKPVPPGPVVPSVDVLPITATLAAGTVKQLEAVVTPAGEDVSWASSDENVATVDSSGLVSAVAAGTATITASTAGASGKATIDVFTPRTFTVHFYQPADWGSGLNIYYWDAQPADLIPQVSWPGVAMTDDGDGWYSYVFNNITQTNLIFNDGSNQTDNLSRGEDGWYYSGEWYDTQPDTGGSTGSTSTAPFTITTSKTGGWKRISTMMGIRPDTAMFVTAVPSGSSWR